jgi:site-specific recombinase XerD
LTALAGVTDSFTLRAIAGHASIRTTQRYVHPQEAAIEAAFQKLPDRSRVVTEGGHSQKSTK